MFAALLILFLAVCPATDAPSLGGARPAPSAPPLAVLGDPIAEDGLADGAAALEVRVLDDAGAPLAAAHVRAEREDDPAVFALADTDATGLARFASLGPGRWVLRADAEGAAPAGGVWRVPASETPTLTVHAAGRVGGMVLGTDGAPADGAEITIVGSGIWPERVVVAGVDGRFSIDSVPPGVYEVSARSGGARAEPRRGLRVEAGARVVLSFALSEGATLLGMVLNVASGEPIAGVRVRASTELLGLDARTVSTEGDGRFSLPGLAPGAALHVDASADGFVAAIAAECTPGANCVVRLEPAASVAGVVLDEDSRPVAGASIEIAGDGSFGHAVRIRAPTAGLTASGVPGRLPVTAEVPPLPNFDGEGPHLAVSSSAVSHAAVRTNERGEFRVEGVPSGTFEVVARAAGYAPGRSPSLAIAPGERRESVEIVLGQGGRIDGHVVDEAGEGVRGALIEYRDALDPVPHITVTGEGGAFTVDGVVGEVTLRAIAAGRPPVMSRVEVEATQTTVTTLRLDPAGLALRGRVLDVRGRPIDGAQVRIESMRAGGGVVRTVTTELDGTFLAERIPAPPLRVVADHRSYAIAAGLDVESLEATAELTLVRPVAVRGTVHDAWTTFGIEGAEVRLVSASVPPVVRSVETNEEGAFVAPRVAPGRYALEVTRDGYVLGARGIVVRASRWEDQEIEALALEPGARVEGDVVDRLGQVTPGVLVTLDGEGDEGPRAHTDERGHFVLEGLAAGEHVILAVHPSAGEVEHPVAVVRGREPADVVMRLPERAHGEVLAAPLSRRGVPLEVSSEGGAVVIDAVHGRLAASGVLTGDVLCAVDGEAVTDLARADALLRGTGPAVLTLVRDGEPFYLRADRRSWTPR